MRSRALAVALASGLMACSEGPLTSVDTGVFPDAAPDPYDAGVIDLPDVDAGSRPDAGMIDAGFEDPTTLAAGVVPINGLRTFVELRGTLTSTMPPLFVLQRGPAPGHDYLPPLLAELTTGRTVVYYDMRGTGRTSFGDGTASSTISTRKHIEDFAAVVEHVGATYGVNVSKIDILGHEYGGAIGFRYAAANPAKVERLVVVNPFPADINGYADFRAEVERRLTSSERMRYYAIINRPECWGAMDTCYQELWNIVGPHYLCDANQGRFRELINRNGSARTEYFYIERDLRNASYDWRSFLPSIQARTTIITGACDPIPTSVADAYASGIPGAVRYDLTGSGQYPMLEEHAVFIDLVKHGFRRP